MEFKNYRMSADNGMRSVLKALLNDCDISSFDQAQTRMLEYCVDCGYVSKCDNGYRVTYHGLVFLYKKPDFRADIAVAAAVGGIVVGLLQALIGLL